MTGSSLKGSRDSSGVLYVPFLATSILGKQPFWTRSGKPMFNRDRLEVLLNKLELLSSLRKNLSKKYPNVPNSLKLKLMFLVS